MPATVTTKFWHSRPNSGGSYSWPRAAHCRTIAFCPNRGLMRSIAIRSALKSSVTSPSTWNALVSIFLLFDEVAPGFNRNIAPKVKLVTSSLPMIGALSSIRPQNQYGQWDSTHILVLLKLCLIPPRSKIKLPSTRRMRCPSSNMSSSLRRESA